MRRGTQFEADAFRRIFETSPIGIMVLAADHGRVLVNDAFCAMLGYTRDELLAVAPQVELNHPDDLPNAQASLDALVAGERGVYVRRTRYRHREGHYVWVEVSVAIMVDEDDEDHQFIVQARDITTTLDQEQQLQRLADHDDLTTLLNRRVFDQRLRLHASAVQLGRRRAQGSVLVIDLDNFKHHNDAYGHAVGDAILVGVAWALRERLREHDVIGRLGGDEFAVLLPDAAGADAEAVAGSLLHRISETAAAISPDSSHPVTASIGIADFLIDRDADAVMLEADRALYDAKSAGRNRWARHAGLVEPAGAAGATRAAIGQYAIVRDVITQELVTVVCQPFVDYATSRVVGWETLARASHPVHGPIPPVDLVRLATRHDLIDDLTRQVIDQGLNAATAAAGLVNGPITVTANIELTQIRRHSDLIDWLLARELPTGATLLLEITERGGDDWTREHESVAHRLAVRGIQLGLDDYGTGYSRLSFLRARTWDLIKLDQRFLQTRTARDRDVVAAFVELVHGSGIQTLAEGIETEEQHGWARSVGIDLGQGYLYGKPVPADVLLALLAERGLRVPAQR